MKGNTMKKTIFAISLAVAAVVVTAQAKSLNKNKVQVKGSKHNITHDSSYNKYKHNTGKKIEKDIDRKDIDVDINNNKLERKMKKEAVKAVL